jgi:hypothetical protein
MSRGIHAARAGRSGLLTPRVGRRRALRLASAAILATCLVLTIGRGARSPDATVSANTWFPLARAIEGPGTALSKTRLTRTSVSWAGGRTTASTGETVTVYVSVSLPAELGTAQTWADFIAGLLHGNEISLLTAYIATFAEMQEICGEYALGCYAGNRMVATGETVHGITAAEVVRHEYGHHIALHRLNTPWLAIDWGPKNWSTTLNVCWRTEQGSAYPGDEGDRYSLNPGEAWAETYRLLNERWSSATGSGWQIVDGSFYPNEAAFQAAEQDVLRPWASPRNLRFSRSFTKRGRRAWVIPLSTPLDGSLEITVSLPKNGLQDVSLIGADRKSVLASGLWSSRTTKRLTTTVCGERVLFVRITQKGAFGRVVVRASVP